MDNMLAVAVDFCWLLFIGHEVETGELVEQEYRMRYIGNKEAREKYAQQMQDRLDVLGVADMLVEAQQMRDLVRVARAAVGLVHNRQTDTEQWVPEADAEHVVNTVTGERREWMGTEQQAEDDAETQRRRQKLARRTTPSYRGP